MCDYNELNYTVIVEDDTGMIVAERVVGSDSCLDGLCSLIISFSLNSNSTHYWITIVGFGHEPFNNIINVTSIIDSGKYP